MLTKIILQHKIASRKNIARLNFKMSKLNDSNKAIAEEIIIGEKDFLSTRLCDINSMSDLVCIIDKTRAASLLLASEHPEIFISAEDAINLPGAPAESTDTNPDGDNKPLFGALMGVLREEVVLEVSRMDSMGTPTQDDLTRWALKDAVLEFYQRLNLPPNTKIVETIFDDRLVPQLSPDFDVIYRLWMERLDVLVRRDDKYTLISDEYDKAELDIKDSDTGMRGSAFEKQLDRYREDFMQKLKR